MCSTSFAVMRDWLSRLTGKRTHAVIDLRVMRHAILGCPSTIRLRRLVPLPEASSGRTNSTPGEQLRRVRHRLELKGVAGGVEQEHGRLLAGLAGEADGRRDDEFDAAIDQSLG